MNKASALLVLLALVTGGCAYLRPPAPDQDAFRAQQQVEKQRMSEQEREMWDATYYVLEILGTFATSK